MPRELSRETMTFIEIPIGVDADARDGLAKLVSQREAMSKLTQEERLGVKEILERLILALKQNP